MHPSNWLKRWIGTSGLTRHVKLAQQILPRTDAFGFVSRSSYFPPRAFLNQFLAQGKDPLIQDRYLNEWKPFELSPQEYRDVLAWWVASHPGAEENALGTESWNNWFDVIFPTWD